MLNQPPHRPSLQDGKGLMIPNTQDSTPTDVPATPPLTRKDRAGSSLRHIAPSAMDAAAEKLPRPLQEANHEPELKTPNNRCFEPPLPF